MARPARQRGRANLALWFTISVAVAGLLAGIALWLRPVSYELRAPVADAERSPAGLAVRQEPTLRLVGSNTIGSELAPALAKAYLEQKLGAVRVQLERAPGQHRQWIQGILPGDPMRRRIEVAASGSDFAFEALGRGDADIGMSSRAMTPSEMRMAALLGESGTKLAEHVLGLDGIAVVVHPNNPIDTLTVEQLNRIFSGTVRTWAEIGGPKRPILCYVRNRESGTYASFLALTDIADGQLAWDAQFVVDSQELSDAVAQDPNGIGFVGLSYVGNAKAVKVAVANRSGFSATRLNVHREDYPLTRRLYLYAPANSSNPMVADFVEFALSPAGQKIVESAGFLSRRIEPAAASDVLRPLPLGASE